MPNDIPAEQAPLRMTKGRLSYNGLSVVSGQILEEENNDLRWPQCIRTYKMMAKDATISPALNLMEMNIARVGWEVKAPEGKEEELKEKMEFLKSVMHDMEHTWGDFIRQAVTFNRYGFAPIEKVYRKRTKASGSRFNDGYIGVRDLPLISHDSIASWDWTEDGTKLSGMWQWQNVPTGEGKVGNFTRDKIYIPREKFLLFRADPQKDSPIGTSPLNGIYVAWRFKSELEKHESIGIATDLRGLKVLKIPPRYLSEDASPEEKQTREVFERILAALHTGEQSGIMIPMAYDESGKPLFDFELKSVLGQSSHDVSAVINRYKKEMIVGLMAPHLTLGQDGSGSFALADALTAVTNVVIEARLNEIKEQLNHDFVKQLFQLNGWSTEVLPYFEYTIPDSTSVDDLGKYLQRIAAAGMLHNGAETANWIAEQAGLPKPFNDTDIDIEDVREQMTKFDSNAGEGLDKASGNGTSDNSSDGDNSVSNMENT